MLETGIKGHAEDVVTYDRTALHIGSGLLEVYGTPFLTALMELTAAESVAPYLEVGFCTVGISLHIQHVSATPVGMKVWCDSNLIEIDRKRLVFEVAAYDGKGLIGKGRHERFIVEREPFFQKAQSKLNDR